MALLKPPVTGDQLVTFSPGVSSPSSPKADNETVSQLTGGNLFVRPKAKLTLTGFSLKWFQTPLCQPNSSQPGRESLWDWTVWGSEIVFEPTSGTISFWGSFLGRNLESGQKWLDCYINPPDLQSVLKCFRKE